MTIINSRYAKRILRYTSSFLVMFLMAACESGPGRVNPYQDQFINSGVRSILVVPVVNKSVDVDAPTSVLTSLPTVLANRGYYVFGVNTTKVVLEHEGLSEPGEIHQLSPSVLAETFGADSIFYVTIEKWTTEYILISATTQIDLHYEMKDRLGNSIWSAKKVLSYTSGKSDSGHFWVDLISSAVTAAIVKATPKYMELTRKANAQVLLEESTKIPEGPYLTAKKELGQ